MSQTNPPFRKSKDFEADLENLINLNQGQIAWLIQQNVLSLSLNKSVFEVAR